MIRQPPRTTHSKTTATTEEKKRQATNSSPIRIAPNADFTTTNAARRWAATEKTPSQISAAARIDSVATCTSTRLTGRAAQCERAASARPFLRSVEITVEREHDPQELRGGDETEAAHDKTDLRRC